jgi:3-oxoacyl-[acyl-carrier protein] reductase|tara:strand:+ start:583 stop:1284 length:702 start_codon:yes stop_codon:yes gene_type:complete
MDNNRIILITGTSKGIGQYLVEHYTALGYRVIGCSRSEISTKIHNYDHYCIDVTDENRVKTMFNDIRKKYGQLDILINNAGIASMNHFLLTTSDTVDKIMNTNFKGTFLFCRESAKLMKKNNFGRIVNFVTVAVPLRLEGEAIYAASKAAVISLTQILAKELAPMGITVNAIGPTPTQTDLIRSVPQPLIDKLIKRLAIPRLGEFQDISNVLDFFINDKSNYVTGQTIYLGGA